MAVLAAKKAAPAKKAAATKKAAPAAAESNGSAAKAERAERDAVLTARILELRDAEEKTSWFDIAQELEIGEGKAMFLYMIAHVKPNERIHWKDDDELAAKIVPLRDEGKLSWGILAARAGAPESKLKSLYEAATGTSVVGNRIGKGGRYPTGAERPVKAAAAKKAPASKKAAMAEKVVTPTNVAMPKPGTPLSEYSLSQLKVRLNGKSLTYQRNDGKTEKIAVKNVTKLNDSGEVTLSDQDGKSRTLLVTGIKSASK